MLLCVEPQKPKKDKKERKYKTGPKTGEKHASSPHGSRKGFRDFVDITDLGETRTHKSIIDNQLVVKCVGRRHYVAIDIASEFIVEDVSVASGPMDHAADRRQMKAKIERP